MGGVTWEVHFEGQNFFFCYEVKVEFFFLFRDSKQFFFIFLLLLLFCRTNGPSDQRHVPLITYIDIKKKDLLYGCTYKYSLLKVSL